MDEIKKTGGCAAGLGTAQSAQALRPGVNNTCGGTDVKSFIKIWALNGNELPIPSKSEAETVLQEVQQNVLDQFEFERQMRGRWQDPSNNKLLNLHHELGPMRSREIYDRAEWFIEMNKA